MAGVHIIPYNTAPAQDFTLKMLVTQAECDMRNQIKQTHNRLDDVCIDCLRDLVQQPMYLQLNGSEDLQIERQNIEQAIKVRFLTAICQQKQC